MSGAVFLDGPGDTLALGRALALNLPDGWKEPVLLLRAGLGSGKTTLTRGLVETLPGGGQAEVASPSFNLANVYPTRPTVVHVDLYRLGEGHMDESLEELLDTGQGEARLIVVEWSQYLPGFLCPPDRLELEMSERGQGRQVVFTAKGHHASRWLERTLSTFLPNGTS